VLFLPLPRYRGFRGTFGGLCGSSGGMSGLKLINGNDNSSIRGKDKAWPGQKQLACSHAMPLEWWKIKPELKLNKNARQASHSFCQTEIVNSGLCIYTKIYLTLPLGEELGERVFIYKMKLFSSRATPNDLQIQRMFYLMGKYTQ